MRAKLNSATLWVFKKVNMLCVRTFEFSIAFFVATLCLAPFWLLTNNIYIRDFGVLCGSLAILCILLSLGSNAALQVLRVTDLVWSKRHGKTPCTFQEKHSVIIETVVKSLRYPVQKRWSFVAAGAPRHFGMHVYRPTARQAFCRAPRSARSKASSASRRGSSDSNSGDPDPDSSGVMLESGVCEW